MLPLHGRAVSRERYFRRNKKSSIVWTTLPSQPYVFCIISDIFCRWTCPPRARALVPLQYSCCVLHSYLVAILLACHPLTIPYLVCVDAATARARSLTRTVFSEEQKIFHSLNDAPQSTICLLYYRWYILPVNVPAARAHWYLDRLCCTPIWLLFCLRVILLPSRIWFA